MTPLKIVKKTIRLTEKDYDFIEALPGRDFSGKLCSLIEQVRTQKENTVELSPKEMVPRFEHIDNLLLQILRNLDKLEKKKQ